MLPKRLPILLGTAALIAACGSDDKPRDPDPKLMEQGRQIFRFDTFGDEANWADRLRMHEVIASAVDPTTALAVGLKVDADKSPQTR